MILMEPSIGIVTLNAKHIHASLSLRYLRNAARAAGFQNVWIREFIVNQPTWKIAAEILRRKPDVLGISVYIWNRAQCLELIERLRKQRPSIAIAIGGPEMSFEPGPAKDYTLVAGEGERKWVEFLEFQRRGESPPEETLRRWSAHGIDLPDLSPAYAEEDIPQLAGRMVYLETSRGCPYRCAFCLSALDKTVRYFDEDAVRRQITLLVRGGADRIKFVDRTFNLKPEQTKNFMAWLLTFKGVSFHFEIAGDLLDEKLLDFLDGVPEGMFQFEIGIQTTSPATQTLLRREQDTGKIFTAVRRLVQAHRVHVHCDLIFGLPGETLEEILDSFQRVFALGAQELQLGFLKFLPGAPIRETIESHGYAFQSTPPYEVLSHKDLSGEETLYLKKFVEVFDLFFNSKRFSFSLRHLLTTTSPVEIVNTLLAYMDERDLFVPSHSLIHLYEFFCEVFSCAKDPLRLDLLRLDYLYAQRVYRLPEFLKLPPSRTSAPKTWPGDRKTPYLPFLHEIRMDGPWAVLTPAPAPVYYAVVHPNEKSGYLSRPTIERFWE